MWIFEGAWPAEWRSRGRADAEGLLVFGQMPGIALKVFSKIPNEKLRQIGLCHPKVPPLQHPKIFTEDWVSSPKILGCPPWPRFFFIARRN